MSIEIYYYSGTGNSLHVARELSKRFSKVKLIPIISLLNKKEVITESDTVGFVFPIYFTTVPAPVRKFLNNLNLQSAEYIFSVATRLGTFCVANINIKQILKKKGKKLDAQFVLTMASNTPTGLVPGPGDKNWINKITKEKVSQLETEVQSRLDEIADIVAAKEKHPKTSWPNPFLFLVERFIYFMTHNLQEEIDFYTDSTCTGCGICERVCPSQKVKMKDEQPIWQKNLNCYYCYACFNFCSTQSILVKDKYTKKDGRYFHPEITADDIVGQKQLNVDSE